MKNIETALTADELRNMDGDPAWCVGYGISLWCIVQVGEELDEDGVFPFWASEPTGECFGYEDYGREWLAYRRKADG